MAHSSAERKSRRGSEEGVFLKNLIEQIVKYFFVGFHTSNRKKLDLFLKKYYSTYKKKLFCLGDSEVK